MKSFYKFLAVFLILALGYKIGLAESLISVNEKALEGMDEALLSIFKLLIFLLIGGFIGYHLGVILRVYIKFALWGFILYVISLIVLQSLGVIKIETDTILKTIFIIIPFIKGLINLTAIPKTIWWGMLIGFILGFLNIDIKSAYKVAKGKEKEKK